MGGWLRAMIRGSRPGGQRRRPGGTGSTPPSFQGWQRATRAAASAEPSRPAPTMASGCGSSAANPARSGSSRLRRLRLVGGQEQAHPAEDDEHLRPVVDSHGYGSSVQCSRTVASSWRTSVAAESATRCTSSFVEAGYVHHYADLGESVRRLGLSGDIAELGEGEVVLRR